MQTSERQQFLRTFVIGLVAFLTLVDLFATQAILPALARAYNVRPAAMGLAVNASTIGMAIASLVVGLLSRRIDRRRGIAASLALLAIPTAALAVAQIRPAACEVARRFDRSASPLLLSCVST